MRTLEFLHRLRGHGIKVWLDGDALRFRALEASMTPDLRSELTARKAEVVRFLKEVTQDSRVDMPPIRRAPRDGDLPLSFAQQRLWFVDQLDPDVPSYSVYDATDIARPINVVALQQALTEVVRRHEILRTTFHNVAGIPVQRIAPPATFPLSLVDLTRLSDLDRHREAERLKREASKLPFDLARGPLLRVTLVKLADAHYLWLLTIHHIITDDWSKKLFDQELDTLYSSFCNGRPSPLPELAIQFADFAVWQREWFQGKVLESHADYWVEQLKGDLPILDLPTDRRRCQSFRGTTGRFRFSRSASRAVKTLSERENVTPFMALVAAYSALLSRYSRQDDIIIGSPISDRNQVETEQLIGFLLNTLILRTRLTGNPTFREFLKHVREVCLGAQMHQEVPYEVVLPRLRITRDLSGNPLFHTMLGLLNTPPISKGSSGFWSSEPEEDEPRNERDVASGDTGEYALDANNGTTKFDLSVTLVEENHEYQGATEYNTDLFDHETIAVLIERFQTLLQSAAADPERRISELSLMTETERRRLLTEWSGRDVELGRGLCIQQLFEAQVERSPQAVAVEFDGRRVTYAELNARANQVARFLRKRGAGPEAMVGIYMERSPEMLVATLGTLKAGAAYVPLEPLYPQQRLALVLEDARVSVLLTEQRLLDRLPHHPACVCVDTQWEEIAAEPVEDMPCETSANAQVCVLYTSGSTGRPKGVMLTHEGLVNYTVSAIGQYDVVEGDRVLQFASLSFDASLEEIYPALCRGATVVLRKDEMLDSVATFVSECGRLGITLMVLPTAYWHEIVSRVEVVEMPASLRLLVIGGERRCRKSWRCGSGSWATSPCWSTRMDRPRAPSP